MNKINTTLSILFCIVSCQIAFAQVSLTTDCDDLYLVKVVQQQNKDDAFAIFTYDKDRHATSLTQGSGSSSNTIDITWTPSYISYNYMGYEIIKAQLDDRGNTLSLYNIYGEKAEYQYSDGYLVSYTVISEDGGTENGRIVWHEGNPTEVRVNDQTYKFEYSDIPNNTNIDFGILQCTDVSTFALPMGKGLKNLPIHLEEYYGTEISEICDISYEFDEFNRPVKCISRGIDYEDHKAKDFTSTMILSYDESFTPLSIAESKASKSKTTHYYNLTGQKVTDTHKGIIIRDGKKYIVQ